MADLTSERSIIQVEEVTTGAAVSESVGQKIGGSTNLMLTEGRHLHAWKMSGPYSITGTPDPLVDMILTAYRTVEIFGFSMFNGFAGSAGDLEIDLVCVPADGGGEFSLFSTRPKIPFGAGDAGRIVRRIDLASTLFASAGVTLPVFSTTVLNPGDVVKMNVIGKQTGGSNASVELAMRPLGEP